MGLVIGEDEVPFVDSSRVNMFVITCFGAVFGSFDVLESGTTIFIGLFEDSRRCSRGEVSGRSSTAMCKAGI